MKIYITDLAAYNEGHLVGDWYTLPMNEDMLAEAIEDVLRDGKRVCGDTDFHEEYFITDFECDYMNIEEYADIQELNQIAEKMEDLDDDQIVAINLMIENGLVNNTDEAIEHIDDMRNTGETKMEDIAYNYIQECGMLEGMPENLQCYFDYESFGRDLEIEGSYFEDQDGFIWEYAA